MAFEQALIAGGYTILFLGVFLETGFLIGLILPGGETLVFIAGFLSSFGYLNVWAVGLVTFIAAVAADSAEYAFGRAYGPKMFDREDARFFKREYLWKTQEFFSRYGAKTIVIARFIPFVRTLAPAAAGMGGMRYSAFAAYNVIGAFFWGVGMTLLGYFLGAVIPNADQYTWIVVAGVAVVSTASFAASVLRHRR